MLPFFANAARSAMAIDRARMRQGNRRVKPRRQWPDQGRSDHNRSEDITAPGSSWESKARPPQPSLTLKFASAGGGQFDREQMACWQDWMGWIGSPVLLRSAHGIHPRVLWSLCGPKASPIRGRAKIGASWRISMPICRALADMRRYCGCCLQLYMTSAGDSGRRSAHLRAITLLGVTTTSLPTECDIGARPISTVIGIR